MDFVLRDAVESDLDQCIEIVADRFLYDQDHLPALRGMWSHIIVSKSGVGAVTADARAPSHVAHFAFIVFIPDESADFYHACIRPRIGYHLANDWALGKQPFLTREQISKANAGNGLNLLVTHWGVVEPPDPEATEKLRCAAQEHAVLDMRCWNLRSYTNEVFARNPLRDGKQMGEALGFRVAHYSDAALREAGIPREKEPWLWMASREEAAGGPVSLPLTVLFHTFSPPRFGFTLQEQDLLKLALNGYTDESIADLTSTSLTTTKKRFRAIYDKVQNASIDWEQPVFSESSTNGVRGMEVRRRLLNYLREHPEELRPYAPATRIHF